MTSENPLSEYFFRLVMIILYVSPMILCIHCTKYYSVKTAEKIIESYADTMKSGVVDNETYAVYAEQLARIGFDLTISVLSYDPTTGTEDYTDMSKIEAGMTEINGILGYKLKPKDFVHIVARGKKAVVQTSATYYGER